MRALRKSFALVALVTACASGSKPEADPVDGPGEGGSGGAAGTGAGRAGTSAGGKAAGGSAVSLGGTAGAAGGAGAAGTASGAGAAGAAGASGQAGQAGVGGFSGGTAGNGGSGGQAGKAADVCGKLVAECDCGGVRGACVQGACDCAHATAPRAEDNVLTCAEAKVQYPSPSWEAVKGTCDAGRVCMAMPPDSAAEGSNGWGDRFCRIPPNPALTLGGIDEGVGKKIYQYCCLPILDGAGGASGGAGGGSGGQGGKSGAAGKAGASGNNAGTGGTSGGTSAGSGGSVAGSGGTSAGTGGTSAGAGGTNAGNGGSGAGTSGQAGSGGSDPGCVVASPPAECPCVTARNATGRGVEQCLPGATSPTCDCRNAKPVFADTNAPPCGKVEAQTSSFKLACVNDPEMPDCRVVVDPGTWVSRYCAAPLGGSTSVQPINGPAGATYCCKPVDGVPQPICDLPAEPTCESYDDPRTQGVIGKWACSTQNAAAYCKLDYAQPFPAQNDLRPCSQATELSPTVPATQCKNEPLFSRCLVTATSKAWAKANCAYINEASAPNGTQSTVYCCLPPKP